MRVIGLPGRNLETEAWMRDLLASLDLGASETIHYRHWDEGGEPDVPFEAGRLEGHGAELVVAKSMGTLVAASAYEAGRIAPAGTVLIGVPVQHLAPEIHERFRRFADHVPTLFIQQTDDFTGTHRALDAIVGACACGQCVEVPGEDHVYENLAELVGIIKPWAAANAA